jgi:hypothetical protein
MTRDISALIELLDQAFERKSWHGANLRGSILGLTEAAALWRPGEGRHNIWEIVVHAAYWKYAVRRRLTRERRGSFPLKGSNWFPRSGGDDLKGDIRMLVEEHARLREAVAGLDPRRIDRPVTGSALTHRFLITGAASHDLYHAGQIQLIKRLRRG